MNVVIVAYGPDLGQALKEAHDVSNILQKGGHTVHLLADEETSFECMNGALDAGPFELAWLIVHSGPDGFHLAGQTLPPAQLGVWLEAAHCCEVVLNSCFSAEHVQAIQQAALVDAVATIDPTGVKDWAARTTGVHLARALVETGDLCEACRRASGKGSLQYRWFPAGAMADMHRGARDEIREQLQLLVIAVQGDPRTGTVGLLTRVERIGEQLEGVGQRLEALEGRRTLFAMSRGRAVTLLAALALLALLLAVLRQV